MRFDSFVGVLGNKVGGKTTQLFPLFFSREGQRSLEQGRKEARLCRGCKKWTRPRRKSKREKEFYPRESERERPVLQQELLRYHVKKKRLLHASRALRPIKWKRERSGKNHFFVIQGKIWRGKKEPSSSFHPTRLSDLHTIRRSSLSLVKVTFT